MFAALLPDRSGDQSVNASRSILNIHMCERRFKEVEGEGEEKMKGFSSQSFTLCVCGM